MNRVRDIERAGSDASKGKANDRLLPARHEAGKAVEPQISV